MEAKEPGAGGDRQHDGRHPSRLLARCWTIIQNAHHQIGGAVGATVGHVSHAPVEGQTFWALIGMGSMLAGALGVPLTAILFSLEVTHCLSALLPLTIPCIAAYLLTSLLMPRSILTEKLSRRGYHLSREYGVDPLELVIMRELMSPLLDPGPKQTLPPHYVFGWYGPGSGGSDGDRGLGRLAGSRPRQPASLRHDFLE